ncbi:MAG TPA: PspC domain-containing protein [Chitinophagales bacterium]|nr:PspC domain-containing protein [Chitinophagales bacterium]
MNKLLNVNIGGTVFQIDESAYHKMDAYLNSIKKKYATTNGGDEIINDIELRIAELLIEQVGINGAVMMQHVESIIATMGRPEDFEAETMTDEKFDYATPRTKHFYRDADNRILGGVCSGIAAYFNVDPLWLRLVFALSMVFFGTGFLLYLILWIIIPSAKTRAEKLEMRGERVNISNIERSIKTETTHMKTRLNEFGEEVKETFSKENVQRTSNSLGGFIESVLESVKPFFKMILRFFVFAIIAICLIALVAICVAFFTDSGRLSSQLNFASAHIFENSKQASILIGGALALIAIPLFSLIFKGMKFLLNVKGNFKALDWTLFALWIVCFTAVIVVGIQLAHGFEYEGRSSEKVEITQPANDIMYIQLDDAYKNNFYDTYGYGKRYKWDEWDNVIIYKDTVLFNNIEFTIERSTDSLFYINLYKSARGNSRTDSKSRAEQFQYSINQKDSIIILPSTINLGQNELWRGQQIGIVIKVPDNKMIELDKQLEEYLNDNAITDNLSDKELFGSKLRMTPSGLKSVVYF